MKKLLVSSITTLLLLLVLASTAIAAHAASIAAIPFTDPVVPSALPSGLNTCFAAASRQMAAAALVDIPSRRADYAALDRLGTQLTAKCGGLVSVKMAIPVTGRADLRFVEFKELQAENRIP